MRKRPLPLESPHWWPLTEAHRVLTARLGSPHLAARDLTLALRDPDGRLPAMARWVSLPRASVPDRLLATPAWWAGEELIYGDRLRFRSESMPSKPNPVDGPLKRLGTRYFVFYVWKPAFEKVFRVADRGAAAPPAKPKTSRGSGRPKEIDRDKIYAIAKGQLGKLGKIPGVTRQQELTNLVLTECEAQGIKPPNSHDLYVAMGKVLRTHRKQQRPSR